MPDTYESIYLTPDQVIETIELMEEFRPDGNIKTFVQVLSRLYDLYERIHFCPTLNEKYFRGICDDREKDTYRRHKVVPEVDEE